MSHTGSIYIEPCITGWIAWQDVAGAWEFWHETNPLAAFAAACEAALRHN